MPGATSQQKQFPVWSSVKATVIQRNEEIKPRDCIKDAQPKDHAFERHV
jgi:hypothetical protein